MCYNNQCIYFFIKIIIYIILILDCYVSEIQNYFYFEFVNSNQISNQSFMNDQIMKSDQNCIFQFKSDIAKSGILNSPNYPNPYPSKLHCIYNFIGRGKERVKIMFNDFSTYKPKDIEKDCNGADSLMVYITTNGQRKNLNSLCGEQLPKQLMSNDNSLTLEFLTLHKTDHYRGFSIKYEFTSNFGITSGKQDFQKVCGFIYSSKEKLNGTFTSPNFPGYYPRDTECHYFFFGEPNERVSISFTHFNVEGILPCTTDTASDYVEFSNYKTVDRKIPRHCGNKIPSNIESDGDFFRITFKTNDRFDETGFRAFYQFKKSEETNHIKQVILTVSILFSMFIFIEIIKFIKLPTTCLNIYLIIILLLRIKI